MSKWCTVESDPAVFEEMVRELNVEGVRVLEIFSLDYDPDFYTALGRIYGFIFLFNWVSSSGQKPSPPAHHADLFFARQVVENACATQALLSVLLNNANALSLGPELANFRDFCMELDPHSRGLSIGESEFIREVHNSFATKESFEFTSHGASSKGDAFHFVAYTNNERGTFEIDGLSEGPVEVEHEKTHVSWAEDVLAHLKLRIQGHKEGEIRFTLLVLSQDGRKDLLLEKGVLEEKIKNLSERAGSEDAGGLRDRLVFVDELLTKRDETFEAQKTENARRKHNYMPLIFQLLASSARSGSLSASLERAYKAKTS